MLDYGCAEVLGGPSVWPEGGGWAVACWCIQGQGQRAGREDQVGAEVV